MINGKYGGSLWCLAPNASDLNIRKGPGTDYGRVQFCPVGVYTIVEVKSGKGASAWGRLKSGIGWISLDFVKRV